MSFNSVRNEKKIIYMNRIETHRLNKNLNSKINLKSKNILFKNNKLMELI